MWLYPIAWATTHWMSMKRRSAMARISLLLPWSLVKYMVTQELERATEERLTSINRFPSWYNHVAATPIDPRMPQTCVCGISLMHTQIHNIASMARCIKTIHISIPCYRARLYANVRKGPRSDRIHGLLVIKTSSGYMRQEYT